MLQKPEALGRLLKQAIELGQFDVSYSPRMAIKGQAIADFIAEFTYFDTTEVASTTDYVEAVKGVETEKGTMSVARQKDADPWIL